MAAKENQVIGVHSVKDWQQHLNGSKESKKLVVVDFCTTYLGPCRVIAPIFAELAKLYTHVTFLKVDVDELKSVAEEWNLEAMPTFIFLKEGKKVLEINGAKKEELECAVDKLAGRATASA